MSQKPIAAGKSSFDLVDRQTLFKALEPSQARSVLNCCCGWGAYALPIARLLSPGATLHAVDLWAEGIERLKEEASREGLHNVTALVADVGKSIPLDDDSVDLCLVATALHDLIQDGTHQGAIREIKRDLRPDGRLAVTEFKKKEGPPGPPLSIRLSPRELEEILGAHGLLPEDTQGLTLGEHTYLSIFRGGL